ncbi:bis-aminopropyl spermidine synthase family protein [Sphaerisporangium perillae]|uniref:bis-aminopropyl spermidine synthase family protein n=1 Tax=Sphaerisporangium perillae TaxID=2935860 RepID=UPI002434D162|nr:bis-aminopropyl spermidine synthase family protein [Sphaerisporangium perillae]
MEPDGVARLLAEAGVDARRFRAALALLCDGAWWTLADLVRESATSRRGVEALLREIGPQRSGERFRLTPAQAGACRALLQDGSPGPADPVAHLLPAHAEVVERMERLIEGAPRARQALDHVAATPETVVRRALLLGARFWLPGARLLCVGDHDLTSLAVAMIHPGVQVTVVDVDDRILAYIDDQARSLDLDVRARWGDLRLGLPPSARGQADLAITDPPYTPEGVGLFVARAAEGLADPERGRVLLAYGASERTPMLALKVQSALHDLNLVLEAMYPDFNRYFGAEAIGSAADLYVLRPTTKTRPAIAARADGYGTAIYTHGPQSVESRPAGSPQGAGPDRSPGAPGPASGPPAAPEQGSGPFLEEGFAPEVLVGDWPKDVLPRVPRARHSTWLAKPYAASPARVAITVPAGLEAALPRLLLATRARQVRTFLAGPAPGLRALSPLYEITVTGQAVDAVRLPAPQDEAGRLLRGILDNAHGKLANTWREGLTRARGHLTRKQARALVSRAAPWAGEVTLLELPEHRLRGLGEAVAASLRLADEVPEAPHDPADEVTAAVHQPAAAREGHRR